MATTKIWAISDSIKRVVDYARNPEKTNSADISTVLEYASDTEKTATDSEGKSYVTGINCTAETAAEEMINVKRHYGKMTGNVGYHAYQSFKPGEITPDECHSIGLELAQRLWGNRFQVIVATHLDKGHLHNHFVLNSVSFIDGKKFNGNTKAYWNLRNESDALCRERGFSVIENP